MTAFHLHSKFQPAPPCKTAVPSAERLNRPLTVRSDNGLQAQGIPIHYSTVCSHVSGLKNAGLIREKGTRNSSGRAAAKLYPSTVAGDEQ